MNNQAIGIGYCLHLVTSTAKKADLKAPKIQLFEPLNLLSTGMVFC